MEVVLGTAIRLYDLEESRFRSVEAKLTTLITIAAVLLTVGVSLRVALPAAVSALDPLGPFASSTTSGVALPWLFTYSLPAAFVLLLGTAISGFVGLWRGRFQRIDPGTLSTEETLALRPPDVRRFLLVRYVEHTTVNTSRGNRKVAAFTVGSGFLLAALVMMAVRLVWPYLPTR